MKHRSAHIVLAGFLTLLPTFGAADSCDPETIRLRGDWGQAKFTVEIADTDSERNQGLMHRESMPRRAGMLFVYDQPQSVAFWMHNTLIPLDMIFIGEDGVVDHVHHNAIPLDTTAIPGGDDIQYVLEINGGLAKTYGIQPGTEIQHSAIAQDLAVWNCF